MLFVEQTFSVEVNTHSAVESLGCFKFQFLTEVPTVVESSVFSSDGSDDWIAATDVATLTDLNSIPSFQLSPQEGQAFPK